MRVSRKQFPVGQGGMHAELARFGNEQMVMVYDCGSVSAAQARQAKPIEREIDQLEKFVGKKEIDYLILSHFHEDHINGVEYLKIQGWTVKHLVLPYASPKEKHFYAASLLANSELANFVLNPSAYLEGVSVIEIRHDEDEGRRIQTENEPPSLSGISRVLPQGAYATIAKHCGWGLALFNYRNAEIADWIDKNFPNDLLANVNQWDDISKAKAEKAYKEACKKFGKMNFNLTSLCAFSGCLSDCDCWVDMDREICFCGRRNNRYGWIHTGDILLARACLQEFITFFSSYFNRAGVVQVPHHGSKNGYDVTLNSQPNTFSVVCVGERNSHKHPNVDVLHKVIQQKGHLVFVTDNQGASYEETLRCAC